MNENVPRRRRLRLSAYDYATPGAYFVTICAHEKKCLLGQVDDSACRSSLIGETVQEEIERIPGRFPVASIDTYVIMPNHVHLLLSIEPPIPDRRARALPLPPTSESSQVERQGQSPCPTEKPSLSQIIGAFKSLSTKRVNKMQGKPGAKLWQPRFYDHVVRGEGDWQRVAEYIENNPARWRDDELYSERLSYAS